MTDFFLTLRVPSKSLEFRTPAGDDKAMVKVLALLVLCAAGAADDAVGKALQGRWTGARYTEGNGENQNGAQKIEVVFKDNTLVCAKESGAPVGAAKIGRASCRERV